MKWADKDKGSHDLFERNRRGSISPSQSLFAFMPMRDLTDPRLIYFKGLLFLLCGIVAAVSLMLRSPYWQTVVLLGISVWCFCRFYYFAFYVIQHYVDDRFRFAGLLDFARYLWKRRHTSITEEEQSVNLD